MPQANITYDVPYNRKLVALLEEMDEKHWRKAGDAYAPTMFSEKLGNFHGAKIGGGSPANQKYILSGNSPAYPPINMNSGLAVHSGGSYSGIDGAVGGYSFNDFLGDAGNVGKELLPLAPLLMGLGHKKRSKKGGFVMQPVRQHLIGLNPAIARASGIDNSVGGYSFNDFLGDAGNVGQELLPLAPLLMGLGHNKRGKKGGSSVGDTLAGIAKTLVPFAPLLLGLGHPIPRKKADVVAGLKHLGAKPSHTFKKLHELLAPYKMKGGAYNVDQFVSDFGKIGNLIKPVAQPILSALTNKAVGKINGAGRRKKGGVISGGDDLESMVEMVRPMDMVYSKGKGRKGGFSISNALKSVGNTAKSVGKAVINNPIVQDVAKDLLKEGLKYGKDALVDYAKGAMKSGAGRGKAVRAEIVKRVMREKGCSMIDASKYVKAHGLY